MKSKRPCANPEWQCEQVSNMPRLDLLKPQHILKAQTALAKLLFNKYKLIVICWSAVGTRSCLLVLRSAAVERYIEEAMSVGCETTQKQ